jgi:hypothetical protein
MPSSQVIAPDPSRPVPRVRRARAPSARQAGRCEPQARPPAAGLTSISALHVGFAVGGTDKEIDRGGGRRLDDPGRLGRRRRKVSVTETFCPRLALVAVLTAIAASRLS